MKKCILLLMTVAWLTVLFSSASADFDERLWEMYAEILVSGDARPPSFGGIYIDSLTRSGGKAKAPFADIRVVTDRKEEVPYGIKTLVPETGKEELPVTVRNISVTGARESYCEGVLEEAPVLYNELEVLTDDSNFHRRMRISGSRDGKTWNILRDDAVIFDHPLEEVRHTRVTVPDSDFRYIAVTVFNDAERPLKIRGMKVFHRKKDPGAERPVGSFITQKNTDPKTRETAITVSFTEDYPISRVSFITPERNFQRRVRLLVKQAGDTWTPWAEDTIFSFDVGGAREEKLSIAFPEVSAREMKIIIQNFDSPPLNIQGANVSGHKRLLVFKMDRVGRYYLFWGNPYAKAPTYDVAPLLERYGTGDLKMFSPGHPLRNPGFTGHEQGLPFTERHKTILYLLVVLVIAGLFFLQYRVIKRTKKDEQGNEKT